MAKLLCNLCLSKEHNTGNCPRLQNGRITPAMIPEGTVLEVDLTERNRPRNTVTLQPLSNVTPRPIVTLHDDSGDTVTLQAAPRDGDVTLQATCPLCAEKDAEIRRLRAALEKYTHSNAQRQRAYRGRHGGSDERADS